jgi:hypothetical protein
MRIIEPADIIPGKIIRIVDARTLLANYNISGLIVRVLAKDDDYMFVQALSVDTNKFPPAQFEYKISEARFLEPDIEYLRSMFPNEIDSWEEVEA